MKALSHDSIIFDMDGTLWDAVDSYCQVWNLSFRQLGKEITIRRQQLLECMGLTLDRIFSRLVDTAGFDVDEFLERVALNEDKMMPALGGKLYEGVAQGIKELSKEYKLFMVSNCGANGLKNFMTYTALTEYFTDSLTFGETLMGKAENIALIKQRHSLASPVYVGDTQGDCEAAHAAGVPMVFAAYGFGKCQGAEYRADSFTELTRLFLK